VARQDGLLGLDPRLRLRALPAPVRNYKAFTLTANKRFSNNWFMNASYTWSELRGNFEAAAAATAWASSTDGHLQYDVPEAIIINNRYGYRARTGPTR